MNAFKSTIVTLAIAASFGAAFAATPVGEQPFADPQASAPSTVSRAEVRQAAIAQRTAQHNAGYVAEAGAPLGAAQATPSAVDRSEVRAEAKAAAVQKARAGVNAEADASA